MTKEIADMEREEIEQFAEYWRTIYGAGTEEEKDYFQEFGYPKGDWLPMVIYYLQHEEIPEKGLVKLWDWFSNELGE